MGKDEAENDYNNVYRWHIHMHMRVCIATDLTNVCDISYTLNVGNQPRSKT